MPLACQRLPSPGPNPLRASFCFWAMAAASAPVDRVPWIAARWISLAIRSIDSPVSSMPSDAGESQ